MSVPLDLIIPALRSAKQQLATDKPEGVEAAKEHVATATRNIFDAPPLGIDLDGTIDEAPLFFNFLSKVWPGKVYVVTYRDCQKTAERDVAEYGIRVDEVILAKSLKDKAKIIFDRGIKFYFDDMDEAIQDIATDVAVFKIRNDGNWEQGKWLYSERTGVEIGSVKYNQSAPSNNTWKP